MGNRCPRRHERSDNPQTLLSDCNTAVLNSPPTKGLPLLAREPTSDETVLFVRLGSI
jgi:hypothetical protein